MASCRPVLAPEGTMARPTAPVDAIASTSTVGRPRESSTWRAFSAFRVIMIVAFPAREASSLMVELSLQEPEHLVPGSRPSLERLAGQPARQLLPGRIEILDRALAIDAGQKARRRVVDRPGNQGLRPPRARVRSAPGKRPRTGGVRSTIPPPTARRPSAMWICLEHQVAEEEAQVERRRRRRGRIRNRAGSSRRSAPGCSWG